MGTFNQVVQRIAASERFASVPRDTVQALADEIQKALYELAIKPAVYNVTWDGELTTNIYLTQEDAEAAMRRLNDRHPSDKREIIPLFHAPVTSELFAAMLVAKSFIKTPEALDVILKRAGIDAVAVPDSFKDSLGLLMAETAIDVCEKIAGLEHER